MKTNWTRMARQLPGGMILLLVFLVGCDTLVVDEGEEIVLPQPRDVDFTFERNTDGFGAGETVNLTSLESRNLEGRLDGFQRSEIVAAEIIGAELVRLAPAGSSLSDLLQGARLFFDAEGLEPVLVATLGAPPGNNRAALALEPNVNLAPYVSKPSFTAVLELQTRALPAGIYRFATDVQLRITVTGAGI